MQYKPDVFQYSEATVISILGRFDLGSCRSARPSMHCTLPSRTNDRIGCNRFDHIIKRTPMVGFLGQFHTRTLKALNATLPNSYHAIYGVPKLKCILLQSWNRYWLANNWSVVVSMPQRPMLAVHQDTNLHMPTYIFLTSMWHIIQTMLAIRLKV